MDKHWLLVFGCGAFLATLAAGLSLGLELVAGRPASEEITVTTTGKATITHESVDIFSGETSLFRLSTTTFVNASTGVEIAFRKYEGYNNSRNPSVDLYVNQKKINGKYDPVGGQGVSLLSFSSDNKYFGFRTRTASGCAGTCHSFSITVVDLTGTGTKIFIQPPRREKEYSKKSPLEIANPYIESYTWDNMALIVSFYFIAPKRDEQSNKVTYYRISPKEAWRYDLTSRSYALIGNTSE